MLALAIAAFTTVAGCCQTDVLVVELPLPADPDEPCDERCGQLVLSGEQEYTGCSEGVGADGEAAVLCTVENVRCSELH